MRLVFIGLVVAAAGFGCTKKNPILVCNNGQCTDPQYRYCDADGAIGGEPNTCLKPECSANAFVTCDGSNAITCNSDANDYTSTACQFGCSAANGGCNQCEANSATCSGSAVEQCDANGVLHTEQCAGGCVDGAPPHCQYVSPKYLPDVCDTPGSGTLNWIESNDFDSDLDANCNGGIIPQAGGDAICVVRYSSITVANGATLHAISSTNRDQGALHPDAGRAIAFVSDGDLVIAGTLDVSAAGYFSGPGGGLTTSGGAIAAGQGAGGAGFATAGGNGGSTATNGGANNGGQQSADPATLVTLIGGPRSGDGGGGGAAVLISCRGTVNVTGWLTTSGGGGAGGYHIFDSSAGGQGGGAGGYFVLQGLDVQVTGSVWANGGGGGAGGNGTTGGTPAEDGADGPAGLSGATGGTARSGAGGGGPGGWANRTPQPGIHPSGSGGPGGGGGSMGFFQSYTPTGVTPTLTPAAASPAFRPNATVPTR